MLKGEGLDGRVREGGIIFVSRRHENDVALRI